MVSLILDSFSQLHHFKQRTLCSALARRNTWHLQNHQTSWFALETSELLSRLELIIIENKQNNKVEAMYVILRHSVPYCPQVLASVQYEVLVWFHLNWICIKEQVTGQSAGNTEQPNLHASRWLDERSPTTLCTGISHCPPCGIYDWLLLAVVFYEIRFV